MNRSASLDKLTLLLYKSMGLMKEKEMEYVDLRFTDPRGKLQHLTVDGKMVDEWGL